MEDRNASNRANVQNLITPLKFNPFLQVTNRASVSDLFKAGPVPGLYVLAFSDGAFYAGKTNDIKQRFCSHSRNHGDIDFLAFKSLPVKLQDTEEKPLIQHLKKNNILLRNIQFISNPDTPRELDFMIASANQDLWIQTGICSDQEHRQVNDEQRYRYTRKHQSLAKLSIYPEICKFIKAYANVGLIAPKMTEMSYWCMTVWPSPSGYVGRKTNQEYVRLNIGNCEVLTIGKNWVFEGTHPGPFFVFHVANSVFTDLKKPLKTYLSENHTGALTLTHRYVSMGEDQMSIAAFGFEKAKELISDPFMQKAIRVGNLGLMRKRACLYSQNHCFDMADVIFEGERDYEYRD